MFLKAEPVSIGTKLKDRVPFLMHLIRSISDGSFPSRYDSISFSSSSTAVSTNSFLYFSAFSFKSGGISTCSNFAPKSSFCQTTPFILTKSTTPFKSASDPIGICNGNGLHPNLSLIISTHL